MMLPPRSSLYSRFLSLVLVATACTGASCSTFIASDAGDPLSLLRSIRGGSYFPSYFSKKASAFKTWSFDQPCDSMEWTPMPSTTLNVTTDEDLEDGDLVIVGIMAPASEGDDNASDDDGDTGVSSMILTGKAKVLDDELGGLLSKIIKENAKTFKYGAAIGSTTPVVRFSSIDVDGNIKERRLVLVGLGKLDVDSSDAEKDVKEKSLGRKVGSAVASACATEKGIKTCSVILPGDGLNAAVLCDLSAAFTENLYADNRYRTGAKKKTPAEKVERVMVMLEGTLSVDEAEAAIARGQKMAMGTFLARDIVNSPHNVLNSVSLADTAKRLAAESDGRLLCYILDKRDCEKRGMGAYLGVARGSETEPQFIHLVYKPRKGIMGDTHKKVGIVGKGLLFDTGGYNIKTAMMELMKFDCGGAAAALCAARTVAALAPEGVEAHFVVAACENMINDRAVVPGDVLVASNGKTIEVVNTDAEGRLTMADALAFVDEELGCERIVELSTLTGACMVALGDKISALYVADDDLAEELKGVSESTGEKVWRMPLEKEYNEQLESKIADLKNLGGRFAGSITAALFLQNFVNKKKPFAHIDMPGPVWNMKSGATGYGAKLVANWVCQQGQQ